MIKKEQLINFLKRSIPYLAVLVASLLSCYIYFLPGLAVGDDIAFHLSMTNDVLYGFEHGYFGLSTNHLHMGGFALNNFAFYGPVTHYGAAIFTLLFSWMGATPIVGLKFMVIISASMGGAYMYRLAYKMSKGHVPVALISAIIFVFLPYRIFCALARCAFAESIAISFIPMIFYGVYSFLHDEEYRVAPYVALVSGAVLIVLSHAFTALVTASFALLYIVFNVQAIIKRRRNYQAFISLGSAAIISLLCVLFYVLNAYTYESANLYNISDAERQWTTYEHMAMETSRSPDFSGFLNFIVIRGWKGAPYWNDESVTSLLFSIALYFVSMVIAIVTNYALTNLKKSIYYKHLASTVVAFIFPIIFQVRAEIYLAIGASLVLYFFISFVVKRLPDNEQKGIPIYKNVDFYFLLISIIISLVLLFIPESWKLVPSIFYQGQFAWRIWGIMTFLVSMLIALLLSYVKFNKPVLVTASVLTCALLTVTMGTVEKRVYYEKRYDSVIFNDGYEFAKGIKYSGAQNEMVPLVFYQNDYTSSYSNSLYSDVRSRIRGQKDFFYSAEEYINPVFLTGSGNIFITEYNSPNNKFHLEVTSESALVQFPQLYYVNYTVKSGGKTISEAENVDGLIAFTFKQGTYDIALSFKQSKGYQATIPLFYIGVCLLIGGGVFGYIYRTKIMKTKEESNEKEPKK